MGGKSTEGYVYLLYDAEHDLVKIGCTKSASRARQKSIMGAHPTLLVNVMNAKVADMFASEAQCHKHFNSERTSGEWFSADVRTVMEYVHDEVNWSEIDLESFAVLARALFLRSLGSYQRKRTMEHAKARQVGLGRGVKSSGTPAFHVM